MVEMADVATDFAATGALQNLARCFARDTHCICKACQEIMQILLQARACVLNRVEL